jgi:hypothetical protein
VVQIHDEITFGTFLTQSPGDEEYDPRTRSKTHKKKKIVQEAMPPPSSEIGRQNMYTLPEDHSHIFSNPMDLSFSGDAGPIVLSSQVDTYGFDDNLVGVPGSVAGEPDISDELAQVLGEDWGGDLTHAIEYVGEVEQGSNLD